MNKFAKIFVAFVMLFSVALSLGACGEKEDKVETYTAYGITHKSYVGIAEVTLTNGKLSAVKFDECFLPATWATISADDATEENSVSFTSRGAIVYVSKYVKVGDKVFTATVNEDSTAVVYSAEGIENLTDYVKTDSNGQWYVEAIKNDNFSMCDATGTALTIESTSTYGKFKSEGNYWNDPEKYPLGWKGNTEKFAAAIVANGFDVTPSKLEDTTEDKTIYFGEVTSSATFSDFMDYFNLAKLAFEKASK